MKLKLRSELVLADQIMLQVRFETQLRAHIFIAISGTSSVLHVNISISEARGLALHPIKSSARQQSGNVHFMGHLPRT